LVLALPVCARMMETRACGTVARPRTPPAPPRAGTLSALDEMDEDDPELYERGLPVVSFRLSDNFASKYPHVQQAWIQSMLRTKGWDRAELQCTRGRG
jgi:hypothetical protein